MPYRSRSSSMADPASLSLSQGIVTKRAKKSSGKKLSLSKALSSKSWAPEVHRFIRSEYRPGWVSATTGNPVLAGVNFRLDRTSGAAELASLYDQYRIVKVMVRIMARTGAGGPNGQAVSAANDLYIGRYFGVVDYDDALAPANIDQLMQYKTVQQARFNEDMVFTLYPRVNIDAAVTAVGAGDKVSVAAPWLDMQNTSVEHYGIKIASDVNQASYNLEFDYKITYFIECKHQR